MTPWIVLVLLAQPFGMLKAAPSAVEGQEPAAIAGGANLAEQIACAPINAPAPPVSGLRIAGGYEGRFMFAPGEPLIVNAGRNQGIQNGQVYFVRRSVRDMFTPASLDFTPNSVHTAGWVTIVDTRDNQSVARVTHACDGIIEGDYLEPFTSPVVPEPASGGSPDYDHPARIVMADQAMQTGSEGTLMLINRGSDDGVRAGERLTLFRHTMRGRGPAIDVGRATVLAVRPQSSLMRIDASNDAIYIGDLAAIHKVQ